MTNTNAIPVQSRISVIAAEIEATDANDLGGRTREVKAQIIRGVVTHVPSYIAVDALASVNLDIVAMRIIVEHPDNPLAAARSYGKRIAEDTRYQR